MTNQIYATGPWSGRQREAHSPARQVVAPTGTIIRGLFPSVKAKRMIPFEQLLERDTLFICEFAPQVIDIREQPFRLQYAMGNKIRRYTPDYAFILIDGSTLVVEVKPARSLAKTDVRKKLLYIREAMYRQGHQFIVLSSETIRTPYRLENLKRLHRFLRQPLPREVREIYQLLMSFHGNHSPVTLGELEVQLGKTDSILRLLAHGELSCDFDQPITKDSMILLKKQETNYVFVDAL